MGFPIGQLKIRTSSADGAKGGLIKHLKMSIELESCGGNNKLKANSADSNNLKTNGADDTGDISIMLGHS